MTASPDLEGGSSPADSMRDARLEFPRASAVIQVAVQRSVDLVSFGLHAAAQAGPAELSVPKSFGQVIAAADRRLSVEDARSAFRVWVLANGLRDCVEALGPALEWARKECVLWSQPGVITRREDGILNLSAELSGETWNRQIVAGARRYDRLPLPEKLRHLEEQFGLQRPAYADTALSINAARNCLTHRSGVVGVEDLADPSDPGLLVRWCTLSVEAQGEAGTRYVSAGSRVEAGETVRVTLALTERQFLLGMKIELSEQEYVQIATTLVFFAQQIEQSIARMQEARFTDSSAATMHGPDVSVPPGGGSLDSPQVTR